MGCFSTLVWAAETGIHVVTHILHTVNNLRSHFCLASDSQGRIATFDESLNKLFFTQCTFLGVDLVALSLEHGYGSLVDVLEQQDLGIDLCFLLLLRQDGLGDKRREDLGGLDVHGERSRTLAGRFAKRRVRRAECVVAGASSLLLVCSMGSGESIRQTARGVSRRAHDGIVVPGRRELVCGRRHRRCCCFAGAVLLAEGYPPDVRQRYRLGHGWKRSVRESSVGLDSLRAATLLACLLVRRKGRDSDSMTRS